MSSKEDRGVYDKSICCFEYPYQRSFFFFFLSDTKQPMCHTVMVSANTLSVAVWSQKVFLSHLQSSRNIQCTAEVLRDMHLQGGPADSLLSLIPVWWLFSHMSKANRGGATYKRSVSTAGKSPKWPFKGTESLHRKTPGSVWGLFSAD